ncbi:MAG: hypothetical protein WBJ06_05165 [Candidatus Methanoculleus thermohydrogenotrophicum]|nr:hypothetical protein [Candidatus Methanoculleus thermohydrogenotrophicum]
MKNDCSLSCSVNYPALKDGVFPLMPPRTPQDKFEPEHTKKVLDLLETL